MGEVLISFPDASKTNLLVCDNFPSDLKCLKNIYIKIGSDDGTIWGT